MLCICTIFNCTKVVNAANKLDVYNSEQISDIIEEYDLSEYIDLSGEANVTQVFDDLTEEAKQLFVHYMATYNQDLYQFHLQNVDEDQNEIFNEENLSVSNTYNFANTSTLQYDASTNESLMKLLDYYLSEINDLNQSVVYALMGVGSSIISVLSNITPAQIVGFLIAAGCLGVLVANWSNVSDHWSAILKAFKNAFTSYIQGKDIDSAFEESKPHYTSVYDQLNKVNATWRAGNPTASLNKHMDSVKVMEIIHRRNPISAYYSPSRKMALIVFTIPNGFRADLNQDYYHHSSWQLTNFDLSGAKLFVLFSLSQRTYFHAHIRLFRDDTETMRYANNMTWRFYPVRMYDSKYEIGSGQRWLYGNIYTR